MNAARGTLTFVDDTLDAIVARPGLWGAPAGVELQVIRLLEVRGVVLDTEVGKREVAAVTESFVAFLRREFPDSPPYSLWSRIQASGGDEVDFGRRLGEFVTETKERQALQGAASASLVAQTAVDLVQRPIVRNLAPQPGPGERTPGRSNAAMIPRSRWAYRPNLPPGASRR